MSTIGFGDTVRIRPTVEMEELGLAGRTGLVYGSTTPSVTGVKFIGCSLNDRALSVHVEGRDDPLWLAPDLVEFVDHTPGLTVRIGKRHRVRGQEGEWIDDIRLAETGSES
jgi:hypothetical protein